MKIRFLCEDSRATGDCVASRRVASPPVRVSRHSVVECPRSKTPSPQILATLGIPSQSRHTGTHCKYQWEAWQPFQASERIPRPREENPLRVREVNEVRGLDLSALN